MQIEYEDENLLVINKPAGLSVYSTKKHEKEESVLSWVLDKYPKIKNVGDPDRPGIVHRLDRQTSGLLVIAKNNSTFDYLKKLFSSRNISKEYLALVYGAMPRHGIIEQPLTKIGQEGRSKVRVDQKGKPSVTEYWSIKYYSRPLSNLSPSPGERTMQKASLPKQWGGIEGEVDQFTLLRVKLHTGRTHQIRVHFSSEGHPVMGDDLYGKPASQKLSSILGRQFLHASRLELQLPGKTWLEIESEIPQDLQNVLSKLQRN